MNEYDELLPELCKLEEWFKGSRIELVEYENKFSYGCRSNYITILFEFYKDTINFYEANDDTFDINSEYETDLLIKYFGRFIDSCSKLLSFFEFANVKEPDDLRITFYQWNSRYLGFIL